MYRVISPVKLKVQGAVQAFSVGAILKMPEAEAGKLISLGKIEPLFEPVDDIDERMAIQGENTAPDEKMPYVTSFDSLVIPFNSPLRYQYWKGGMSPCDTLKELGRCDLIPKYRDPNAN